MKSKFASVSIIVIVIFVCSTILSYTVGVPVPADTIQGLYYPFRDIPTEYANGVPYKNALITDPIRQQFPWKYESIQQIKSGEWPLWNPYNFSGTPLLANIQSGVFYPLNLVFFIPYEIYIPSLQAFALQWSLFIYLQTLLGFIFMYLYLNKIGITKLSSIFGSIAWVFCGYMTAWWEWGNIGHTTLWMPLLFWSIEKYTEDPQAAKILSIPHSLWIFCIAITSSFLAGHWQSFSFVAINTFFYAVYRIPFKFTARRIRQWSQLAIVSILALGITSIQWLPSLEFIQKSAREIDPTQWQRIDWFFPDPHLIGFLAPDFFGNPSTQNYWGVWNYGEFASYIGIIPLLFAISISLKWVYQQTENKVKFQNTLDVTERNIGVGFFLFCIVINGVLITRNPLSELPYRINLPFLGSTQPSRGIVMLDFALAVLAAVGLHYFIQNLNRRITKPIRQKDKNDRNVIVLLSSVVIMSILGGLWFITLTQPTLFPSIISNHTIDHIQVASKNLILPTILALVTSTILGITKFAVSKKTVKYLPQAKLATFIGLLPAIFIGITTLDSTRFFTKFNSFTSINLLYPPTPITHASDQHRYMTDDSRIIAPNINLPYHLRTVEGYDPLYFDHYGKYIGMWVREAPDLTPYPANRILTPHLSASHLADLAAVKHLYSFSPNLAAEQADLEPIQSYKSINQYQKLTALNYLELLTNYHSVADEQSVANDLFQLESLNHAVILASHEISNTSAEKLDSINHLQIVDQTANQLRVNVNNPLTISVLLYRAESYDDGWSVHIDNQPAHLLRTNFSFQGTMIPPGFHTVTYTYQPNSFKLGSTITTVTMVLTIVVFVFSTIQNKHYAQRT